MHQVSIPTMAISILALLLGSTTAFAIDLTVLAGYQFNSDFEIGESEEAVPSPASQGAPGEDIQLASGEVFSVAVDFLFSNNPNQRIGFYATHHIVEFDSNAGLVDRGMDVTHVHFTAMNYYPNGKWEPFILAGLGAGYFSPEDKSLKNTTKLSGQIAAGTNYKITENLLLRFEARWIPTFFDGGSAGICSGGCTIVVKSDMYSQFQTNAGLQFRF